MRKLIVAASVASACLFAMATPVIANAAVSAPRPSAAFAFKHDSVDKGIRPILTYRTAHLPRRSVVYLQRQFGSARVWKNVELLKKAAATITAPGVQIGKYEYRIWVGKSRRTVVTSAVHPLYSYGRVGLGALCPASGYLAVCTSSTVQIGTTIFTFVVMVDNGVDAYPNYETVIQLNSTSCDSLSLQFATDDSNNGGEAYVEVIQSRSDPQNGSTPIDTIGNFSATLNGGPFYLEGSENNAARVYLNGWAMCYTTSGTP